MEHGADDNLKVQELLENAGWMNSLARALVEEPSSAEDLVQDTWTALLEHRPSRVSRGWLAKVLRNLALSRSRSESARRRREKLVSRPERVNLSPEELVETAELQRKTVGFVLELDEPYRSLVLLRFFREFKPTEIASIQGIPVTTIRTRLGKALELLRMRLDGACGGDRVGWHAAFLPLCASPKPETLVETTTSSTTAIAGKTAATTAGVHASWIGAIAMTSKTALCSGLAICLIVCLLGGFMFIDRNREAAVTDGMPQEASDGASRPARPDGGTPLPAPEEKPLAAPTAAAGDGAQGEVPEVASRTVRWTVIDGARERPVAGAQVVIRRETAEYRLEPELALKPSDEVCTTDESGSVQRPIKDGQHVYFAVLAEGFVWHGGYAVMERAGAGLQLKEKGKNGAQSIANREELDEIRVLLQPGTGTRIRVVDQSGQGCAGLRVTVIDERRSDRIFVTDAQGVVACGGLPPGKEFEFRVSGARADGARYFPLEKKRTLSEPGNGDIVLTVVLGATLVCHADLPMDLLRARDRSVTGWIMPLSKASEFAGLRKEGSSDPLVARREAPIGDDGNFVIGPLGKWRNLDEALLLRCAFPFKETVEDSEIFYGEAIVPHLEPGIQRLSLTLQKGPLAKFLEKFPRSFTVRVLDEDGRPLLDPRVEDLALIEDESFSIHRSRDEKTSNEFEIGNHQNRLPPYVVHVFVEGFCHREKIEWIEDGGVYEVHFPSRILAGAASLTVGLLDEERRPVKAWFHIRPEGGDWRHFTELVPEWTCPRLLPGRYIVVGGTGPDGGLAAAEKEVVLASGESRRVDLLGRRARSVGGRVEPYEAGKKNERVYLSGLTGAGERFEADAWMEKGQFRFPPIPVGRYRCASAGKGGVYGPVDVVLDGSRDEELTLTPASDVCAVEFKKLESISGRVMVVEARVEGSGDLWWRCLPYDLSEDASSRVFYTQRFRALLPPGEYRLRYSLSESVESSLREAPAQVREKGIVVRGKEMTVWLD
jgi:RNA polymerase sigma factor (sigma-70 family)